MIYVQLHQQLHQVVPFLRSSLRSQRLWSRGRRLPVFHHPADLMGHRLAAQPWPMEDIKWFFPWIFEENPHGKPGFWWLKPIFHEEKPMKKPWKTNPWLSVKIDPSTSSTSSATWAGDLSLRVDHEDDFQHTEFRSCAVGVFLRCVKYTWRKEQRTTKSVWCVLDTKFTGQIS